MPPCHLVDKVTLCDWLRCTFLLCLHEIQPSHWLNSVTSLGASAIARRRIAFQNIYKKSCFVKIKALNTFLHDLICRVNMPFTILLHFFNCIIKGIHAGLEIGAFSYVIVVSLLLKNTINDIPERS